MQRSETAIRTTHAGKLPPVGDAKDLTEQVAEVIRKQVQLGLSCVGDGEFWNGRNFQYYSRQFEGITTRPLAPGERGSGREATRERDTFPKLYADMDRVGTMFCVPGEEPRFSPPTKTVVAGPIKGRATEAIRREIDVFKAALAAAGGAEEAFICVFAPGWLDHHIFDEYYGNDEKFVFALAEALREEYRAVVDAGFILQIDDPGVMTSWDMIKPEPTIGEYRRHLQIRIDALNHALNGIPAERVRHHFCWGSWHGAHTHDLPLKEIIDIALRGARAGLQLRGRQCAPSARMDAVAGDQAAGRQVHRAGRGQPRHQPGRASRADRAAHLQLRASGRPRQRGRRHRLRPRLAPARGFGLGKTRRTRRRRAACVEAAVGAVSATPPPRASALRAKPRWRRCFYLNDYSVGELMSTQFVLWLSTKMTWLFQVKKSVLMVKRTP